MAYAKQTLITTQAPIAYDDSFIETIKNYFVKKRATRQLEAMTDRELSDIGISRSDIHRAVSGDLYR
ncbi:MULTISPECIES: DUF1127 domain-containing protein [Sneathiella]|jgi:uncharacterized protein YjiS (DUF1127 family)|uniref:DUF1127 domain-containing protein n=1 Tax=Sneathiella TaxID=510690 RepID=UPI00146DBA5D|nr:DUF1127 domain-containing protein [Sneathiella aquimaris]